MTEDAAVLVGEVHIVQVVPHPRATMQCVSTRLGTEMLQISVSTYSFAKKNLLSGLVVGHQG